jgi:hypothetical protein
MGIEVTARALLRSPPVQPDLFSIYDPRPMAILAGHFRVRALQFVGCLRIMVEGGNAEAWLGGVAAPTVRSATAFIELRAVGVFVTGSASLLEPNQPWHLGGSLLDVAAVASYLGVEGVESIGSLVALHIERGFGEPSAFVARGALGVACSELGLVGVLMAFAASLREAQGITLLVALARWMALLAFEIGMRHREGKTSVLVVIPGRACAAISPCLVRKEMTHRAIITEGKAVRTLVAVGTTAWRRRRAHRCVAGATFHPGMGTHQRKLEGRMRALAKAR